MTLPALQPYPLRPMSRSLGVGHLGLGRHGRRYADHLARGDIREARLVAVWRRDRAAGRRDAAHYDVALAPTPIALCERRDVDIVAQLLVELTGQFRGHRHASSLRVPAAL